MKSPKDVLTFPAVVATEAEGKQKMEKRVFLSALRSFLCNNSRHLSSNDMPSTHWREETFLNPWLNHLQSMKNATRDECIHCRRINCCSTVTGIQTDTESQKEINASGQSFILPVILGFIERKCRFMS